MSEELYHHGDLPLPETPPPGSDPEPWGETWIVGKRRPRVDAYERLSAAAIYPSDVTLPNMLYGAILGCPHPHARVRSIDDAEARSMPGVRGLLHAANGGADVPWIDRGATPPRLFDEICRYEGDAVAAVAAETPHEAQDALAALRVDYEPLPFVVDERDALEERAPAVHEGGNLAAEPESYERGDLEAGFAEADLVLEQEYRTEAEIHTPMELHGCVANWDGRDLTLYESTQGVYGTQSVVAYLLGLPLSRVRVIGRYVGGGFGSKLAPVKGTLIAALLAMRTGRPVKLFVSREESFLSCGNRPAANMWLKAGVKRDGRLTALQMKGQATGGAFSHRGTSLLDWLLKDLYRCPNVKSELTEIYTHAGPARPFRAPGHPPGAWALEQMIDALAHGIGMDPVELRLRNVPEFSQAREGTPPYTSTGLAECLREGAAAFGWEEARRRAEATHRGTVRRGVGMAAATWFVGGGGPPATVVLKLFRDGSVNLNLGASDIGTGTRTVMAMVVAEELGLDPDSIQIENADTGTTQFATPSGGSKTVPTESPAVRDAAIQVKRQLLEMAAAQLERPEASLRFHGASIHVADEPESRVALVELGELRRRGLVVGVGYRGPNPEGKAVCPFAAQFCEVEVDTSTGEVRVLRFLGAHESGRVLDRLTYDNQVYGGITMGIGLGLTEQRVLDGDQSGRMLNRNWHDYKLPTMLDVPTAITSLPIDLGDTEANTTGAKGLGEPVTIPTAAAIANAVHHALGVRCAHAPLTPGRILGELARRDREVER